MMCGFASDVQGAGITPLVIQVSDAENDPVTCSITGLPAGLTQSSECTVSGTLSAAVGDYTVSVTANDGQLDSSPVAPTGPGRVPEHGDRFTLFPGRCDGRRISCR